MGVFLGGALLAPPVYWGVVEIGGLVFGEGVFSPPPFHRVVHRSILLLALAGMWWYLKRSGVHRWGQLGYAGPDKGGRVLAGFLLALLTTAILAAAAFSVQARIWSPGVLRWSNFLVNTTLSCAVVALIEETLFRGGLFKSIQRKDGLWKAAFISSVIYSLVHFFARPDNPAVVRWSSGFVALAGMFRGFTDPQFLVPAFLNLLLLGLIFCAAFEKSGSIFLSLGLHAGFVFGVKAYGFLTEPAPLQSTLFWGTDRLVDSWAVLAGLGALGLWVHYRCSLVQRQQPGAVNA